MRVSAVLVLTNRTVSTSTLGDFARAHRTPLACVEVLGQSVLEHTVGYLQRTGIKNISVVGPRSVACNYRVEVAQTDAYSDRWTAAECVVTRYAKQGIDTVFLLEIGPYAEVDYAGALRFHRDSGAAVTQLCDAEGPLNGWVVNTATFRKASDSRSAFFGLGATFSPYRVEGYVNRLVRPGDVRKLVSDAFLKRCAISPRGREIKPGVWIADNASVHRSARVVAPAYIGSSTAIGASTLITRFSNIERNCRVGRGTVVDSSSILPHTIVGEGLDVAGAIVDGDQYVDLQRNLAVDIVDPQLVCGTTRRHEWKFPVDGFEPATQPVPTFQFAYTQHLARAAGRLSEVFRGEM